MIVRIALPLMLIVSAPALAFQNGGAEDDGGSLAQSAQPQRKTSILVTYGDDACPESTDDEIVVCAQQPESERYRVPKALREEIKEAPVMGGSWSNAVEDYDDIARIGRPNSCSAVGSYGSSGCVSAALRRWHAERRELQKQPN